MSVSVTFNGVAYSVPEDGETGWSSLTDYLVALSNAAVSASLKTTVRTISATPSTVQPTDCVLLCAGSTTVNLPVGLAGQFYAVYDKQGTAQNTPITVNPQAGDTIDGAASYTIKTNYGGLLIQYADSGAIWKVIAEIKDIAANLPRVATNSGNASFVRGAVVPESTAFVSVGNLQSCSAQFTGSKAIHIVIALGDEMLYLVTDYASSVITALSDRNNRFLETDAGTGIYVTKGSNSTSVTFKNRMGGARVIEIRAMTNQLSTTTGWA